jgi:hypothetical protein
MTGGKANGTKSFEHALKAIVGHPREDPGNDRPRAPLPRVYFLAFA